MANAFSIVKIVLLIFCIIVVVLTVVNFVQAVIAINKNASRQNNQNAIISALIAANAVLGLVGAYKEHFLFTLIFAIIQTVLIVLGIFLTDNALFAIAWIGSAILAYVFAFMIKQGHTAA